MAWFNTGADTLLTEHELLAGMDYDQAVMIQEIVNASGLLDERKGERLALKEQAGKYALILAHWNRAPTIHITKLMLYASGALAGIRVERVVRGKSK